MAWTYLLCDRDSDTELADITGYCLIKKISPRLNRPLAITLTCPGDTPAIRDTSFDGLPNLSKGIRTIKALQDDVLQGHGIVWQVGPTGDPNSQSIETVALDPLQMVQRRWVRDVTGSLIAPSFPSPISGAEILLDSFQNSIDIDGALPILVDDSVGVFDVLIPPATDLSGELPDWPARLGDLVSLLTDTGAIDVVLNPVDTHTGAAAGIIAVLNVVNEHGSDLSGSVHFDYGRGDFSISNVRRTFDMETLCNKLWYYLGPRVSAARWQGGIKSSDTDVDHSAELALEEASRDMYGTFMDIRIFDSGGEESSARPLFQRLFSEEVHQRVQGQEMLYVTPQAGLEFRPFIDFNIGDIISSNLADTVGPEASGALQRLYGFDVNEDQDGVERVSELICAASDE